MKVDVVLPESEHYQETNQSADSVRNSADRRVRLRFPSREVGGFLLGGRERRIHFLRRFRHLRERRFLLRENRLLPPRFLRLPGRG